jgi:hypothetical protein
MSAGQFRARRLAPCWAGPGLAGARKKEGLSTPTSRTHRSAMLGAERLWGDASRLIEWGSTAQHRLQPPAWEEGSWNPSASGWMWRLAWGLPRWRRRVGAMWHSTPSPARGGTGGLGSGKQIYATATMSSTPVLAGTLTPASLDQKKGWG